MFQNVQGATPKYGKQKLMDAIAEAETRKVQMYLWTETWQKKGDEQTFQSFLRVMGKEEEWGYISKRRVVRNAAERKGSGGVACIYRKEVGVKVQIAKQSEHEGTLWIERKEEGKESIFVAVVYLVPKDATRRDQVPGAIENLITDVVEFEAKGRVVVGGDLNMWCKDVPNTMRISHPQEENFGEVRVVYERDSQHEEEACRREIEVMEGMNAAGMVMMNGMQGKATEFTCNNSNRGRKKSSSTVDYVFCTENMFTEGGEIL